jgi:hypothetical protein
MPTQYIETITTLVRFFITNHLPVGSLYQATYIDRYEEASCTVENLFRAQQLWLHV